MSWYFKLSKAQLKLLRVVKYDVGHVAPASKTRQVLVDLGLIQSVSGGARFYVTKEGDRYFKEHPNKTDGT